MKENNHKQPSESLGVVSKSSNGIKDFNLKLRQETQLISNDKTVSVMKH